MKIDPNIIEAIDKQTCNKKYDQYGNTIAWENPYAPGDWYDNYGEWLREATKSARIARLKALGLNEYGQTPAEEKAFKDRQRVQLERKKKAEAAILASAEIQKGG